MARQPVNKAIQSRLTAVERGIRSLQANDAAIIKEMRDGFAQMESRFDQIYNHVDGLMHSLSGPPILIEWSEEV